MRPGHGKSKLLTSRSLCVFCGSRLGNDPAYGTAARQFGIAMVHANVDLVYGGGRTGIMGVIADAVMESGGRVTGIIPKALAQREIAHAGITELILVDTMHQRKAIMAARSDGFAALPGGMGTLEELLETLTWLQLGIHSKPCGLLNVGGYFNPLLAQREAAVAAGFVTQEDAALLQVETEPHVLIAGLVARFGVQRAINAQMGGLERQDVAVGI